LSNEFLSAFREAFELEEDFTIHMDDEFRKNDNWDSLTKLSLIASIDETFELIIEEKEFVRLISVKDLYDFIIASKH
jgi:acyl carrier protein